MKSSDKISLRHAVIAIVILAMLTACSLSSEPSSTSGVMTTSTTGEIPSIIVESTPANPLETTFPILIYASTPATSQTTTEAATEASDTTAGEETTGSDGETTTAASGDVIVETTLPETSTAATATSVPLTPDFSARYYDHLGGVSFEYDPKWKVTTSGAVTEFDIDGNGKVRYVCQTTEVKELDEQYITNYLQALRTNTKAEIAFQKTYVGGVVAYSFRISNIQGYGGTTTEGYAVIFKSKAEYLNTISFATSNGNTQHYLETFLNMLKSVVIS